MAVSVARASQHPLLEGRSVFITPNIKPPKEMMSSLVKAVHGQVVEKSQISASAANIQDNLFILSCEEDRAICVPLLDKGIAAYTSELILNGIIIQKLEFERHQLFKNHASRSQTRTRLRKDVCLQRELVKL
ncbi:PAX-interacting protein 1-like [Pistacia vera]|nr:PAX-interacting protein 1-like [Pistacia vera]